MPVDFMPLPILPLDDESLRRRVQSQIDAKTKPLGSLGRLETLAVQIAMIQGRERPRLEAPQLVVFAADHGIVRQGISAFPSEVTWQMVENFLSGGAAVSVLARLHDIELTVMDCGVNHDFAAAHPQRIDAKIAYGTADSTETTAMTSAQCERALAQGAALVTQLPGNTLLLGEMGIGNTSAAAALMARLTGFSIEQCVGRGTGLDDAGVAQKTAVLRRALERHTRAQEPVAVLAALGGFEIATMTGAVLQAAAERRVIVVDGFITTAAVAVATALTPAVLPYCVFSHCSAESGHARWLSRLGVTPLLDLGLRLGEGSGAALAWPLLESACRILGEMASFQSAGVHEKTP